jgi:mono/diheme cytochrome c family protein
MADRMRPRWAELLLLVTLAGLGSALGGCGSPSDAGPRAAVDPAVLYSQMCARCHGADGRGDQEMMKTIPGIRDFSSPQFLVMPPESIEQVIMAGRNQMPGFGASLSRPKIQHLGGYTRRLGEIAAGKRPAAAPGSGPGDGAKAGEPK